MSASWLTLVPERPTERSYLKCQQCRHDKQKCTPLERTWPGERCDRCVVRSRPCSKPSFPGETQFPPIPSTVPLAPDQFGIVHPSLDISNGSSMPYSGQSPADTSNRIMLQVGSFSSSMSTTEAARNAQPASTEIAGDTRLCLESLSQLLTRFVAGPIYGAHQLALSGTTGVAGQALAGITFDEAFEFQRLALEMKRLIEQVTKQRIYQSEAMLVQIDGSWMNGPFISNPHFYPSPFDKDINDTAPLFPPAYK